jgi:hypothetical protein
MMKSLVTAAIVFLAALMPNVAAYGERGVAERYEL